MGLNFAIYESAKTFSESSFFNLNLKNKQLNGDLGSNSSSKTEGTLAAVLRKGLCGAVAGGTSKFIVYPLVSTSTNFIIIIIIIVFDSLQRDFGYTSAYLPLIINSRKRVYE